MTGERQHKFECPQCGRRKCFVRYVDTQNDFSYVADDVGRCDHEQSCGYHMKPGEYFRQNGWARDKHDLQPRKPFVPKPLPPFQPIDAHYVMNSHSPRSTLWQWVTESVAPRLQLSEQQLQRVYEDYYVGATHRGEVIYWQIDRKGWVHGGHIMAYGADGHRQGFQGWTHIPLIRSGILPPDWQLYQCLYGEHLLVRYPDRHVCLVESEKTALVMAAYQPHLLWLATAGSSGLSKERLACLKGRRVTLFPDSGCYAKWQERMQSIEGVDYNISDRLEPLEPNSDLLDLLL